MSTLPVDHDAQRETPADDPGFSQANGRDSDISSEDRFQLVPPPNELWAIPRIATEFNVTERTVRAWLRQGRLPRPWVRRKNRDLWAPEHLELALARYRRCGSL
jgi:hypothetical protein